MNSAVAHGRPQSQKWRRKWSLKLLWLLALAVVAVAGFLLAISQEIVHEAAEQKLYPADAIVVFGAAQYSGRPSPVLRARLDHAFELYQRKLAPVVIITGGFGEDPQFSEGGVGHDYLLHRGIPESGLIAETQGSDTAESARRVGTIMHTNRMHACLAVSDAYHVFRIRKLLEKEGIEVYVAPRPDSRPHGQLQRGLAVLREACSYLLWKVQMMA